MSAGEIMSAWDLEQAIGTPPLPAFKDDVLARLYETAEDDELAALNAAALRAGLLWLCPDKACGWNNLEDDPVCVGCGKARRERITKDDGEWLHCLCGNTPDMGGFDSCLTDGTPVEPLADGPWEGRLYVCLNCGRIVDQYTLEVVGRKAATS
jgi:hypothetical protein